MTDLSHDSARLILDMMSGVAAPIAAAGVSDEDLYGAMVHAFEKGMTRAAEQGQNAADFPISVAAAALVKLARQKDVN